MRIRIQTAGLWALGLLLVSMAPGCTHASESGAKSEPSPAPASATNQPVQAGPAQAEDAAMAREEEGAAVHPPEKPEPAPASAVKPVPPDLKFSPATRELVKLAQAGVSESVMLAFVTNSTSTFNLGADQIVFLNDLGVSSEVIRAMIEQDRRLRELAGQLPPLHGQNTSAAPMGDSAQGPIVPAAAAPQPLPEPTNAPSAQAPEAAVSGQAPTTNITYQYFYDSLAPYGTWVYVDGYGYCWQPSIVVLQPGWRPYCHGGRWVYTDLGWYWHSDYTWGWAAFHYGRWFAHPRWGWLWWPDTVWGPAWVTWRYHPAYCGWAPLPPYARVSGVGFAYTSYGYGVSWSWFTFVSWTHFHDRHPHRHRVRDTDCRRLARESTEVNNIIVGDNNTIINAGISPDRVREHTGQEVRPIRVRPEVVGRSSGRTLENLRERLDPVRGELIARRLPLEAPLAPGPERPQIAPDRAPGSRPGPAPSPSSPPELAAAATPTPDGLAVPTPGRLVDRPNRVGDSELRGAGGRSATSPLRAPADAARNPEQRPVLRAPESAPDAGRPIASAPAPARPSAAPRAPAAVQAPSAPAPATIAPPSPLPRASDSPRSTVTVIGRANPRTADGATSPGRSPGPAAQSAPRPGPTATWTRPTQPPAGAPEGSALERSPIIRPSPQPQRLPPAPAAAAPSRNSSPNVVVLRPTAPPGFRAPAPHPSPRIMSDPQITPVPSRPSPLAPGPVPTTPAFRSSPAPIPAPAPAAPSMGRPGPTPPAAAPAPSLRAPAAPVPAPSPPPAASPRAAQAPGRARTAN